MKTIPDYKGYLATDNGHIYSIGGKSNINLKGRVLKEYTHKQGYKYVCLKKGNKQGWHKVHRLVALAYIPNPKKFPQVNHKDGNKGNNKPENLEWCNGSMNIRHAHNTGLKSGMPGERHPTAKLKLFEVRKIIELYNTGNYTQRGLASMFGVSQRAIFSILKGTTWSSSL